MRIVIALGGNALLERKESPDAIIQEKHINDISNILHHLSNNHELIIVHGNGPQIGLIAKESTNDKSLSAPYPLYVLGAETQGMIGYWIIQAIDNINNKKAVVNIITRTVVSTDDEAFNNPTKFIGQSYTYKIAKQLSNKYNWTIGQDNQYWRRTVPSPEPIKIVEINTIKELLNSNHTVICGGGGGIPVTQEENGFYSGIEAVIDKDLVASLLATELNADMLLILTDTAYVYDKYGTETCKKIEHITAKELNKLSFAAGSMGPKVKAATQYVNNTDKVAIIGSLNETLNIINKKSGTIITK